MPFPKRQVFRSVEPNVLEDFLIKIRPFTIVGVVIVLSKLIYFLSGSTWSILIKLDTKLSRVSLCRGIQASYPFLREDESKVVKIHWRQSLQNYSHLKSRYWYMESFAQAFLLTGTASRVSYVINGPLDFVRKWRTCLGKKSRTTFCTNICIKVIQKFGSESRVTLVSFRNFQ